MEPLVIAFVLVLLSEIVDKTQLVILSLSMRYKAPTKVFAGALAAHALMDGAAVIAGVAIANLVEMIAVRAFIGVAFVVIGFWTLLKEDEGHGHIAQKGPLYAAFATVLLSEFGDKTQITSGLLSARFAEPALVFLGTFLALAIAIGANVLIGKELAHRLPIGLIKKLSGALYIAFGAASLFL